MKLYIKPRNSSILAVGVYDLVSNAMTILKGSTVSENIANFRGAKMIEKNRQLVVKDGVVTEDVTFKSPSSAANFVTGRSSNGLIVWKDEAGRTLKSILAEG